MIDTKELRRLAQAATPHVGHACKYQDAHCLREGHVDFENADLFIASERPQEDAAFYAAANPAAIDELLDRLEVAEKDIALKEKIIDALGSKLSDIANERYALRIKIAEMEKQETVYLFRRKGWEEFCTCSKERYEEFYTNPRVFEVKKLYLAPGAQPAPSVPDLLESLRCACNYIDKLGGVSQQYRAMLASPEAKP